ncbi:MAG: tetratricopeptide repeat protein [Gemmataceae bacterium]|nr:tetratricopeptide repeat protein [Gemmataceae bacterium]
MRTATGIWLALFFMGAAQAETVEELLQQARAALAKRQADEALALAGKAIVLDPKNPEPYLLRGIVYEVQEKHERAVAEFDMVLKLDAKSAEAYNRRGSEQFKLGNIKASLADFDRFLDLKPEEKAGHWKRGISLYYAGRFDDGKKQFDAYEKVDTNDVENAVWHYLCNARLIGIEKARGAILKIGNDKRVPMMQVYALYSGKSKPEDVMAAVKEGNPSPEQRNDRLFYAHLYLGLHAEAAGDKQRALEHMTEAHKHRIGHYMWDVARVHMDLLNKEMKEKK